DSGRHVGGRGAGHPRARSRDPPVGSAGGRPGGEPGGRGCRPGEGEAVGRFAPDGPGLSHPDQARRGGGPRPPVGERPDQGANPDCLQGWEGVREGLLGPELPVTTRGGIRSSKCGRPAVRRQVAFLREIVAGCTGAPQAALISRLNPVIRGWSNYYSTQVSKVI